MEPNIRFWFWIDSIDGNGLCPDWIYFFFWSKCSLVCIVPRRQRRRASTCDSFGGNTTGGTIGRRDGTFATEAEVAEYFWT